MSLTPLPDPPARVTQSNAAFVAAMDAWFVAQQTLVTEFNTEISALNTVLAGAFTGNSTSSVAIGTGTKNFTVETGLSFVAGQSVIASYDGSNYMTGSITSYDSGTGALVLSISDVTGSGTYAVWTITLQISADLSDYLAKAGGTMTGLLTLIAAASGQESLVIPHGSAPSSPTNGSMWTTTAGIFVRINGATYQIGTLTGTETYTNKNLTAPTISDPVLQGTPVEDIFTIPDGAGYTIEPANGSTQLWTLGANRTPTLTSIAAGESVRLGVDDGAAYTLTLSGVTWRNNGASAPTLKTSGYTWILIENVGGTLYADLLGDAG